MTQYINKSALVAEIERRISEYETSVDRLVSNNIRLNECKNLLSFIDTLEVKEVEEPVVEDLEEAADACMPECMWGIDVNGDGITENGYDFNQMIEMFKAGAKWKEQQMMKDVITIQFSSSLPNEIYNPLWINGTEIGDKVKLIIIKED